MLFMSKVIINTIGSGYSYFCYCYCYYYYYWYAVIAKVFNFSVSVFNVSVFNVNVSAGILVIYLLAAQLDGHNSK